MSSNILLDYKCSLIQKMFEYGSWNNLYSMKSVRDFKLIAFCAFGFVDFFVVKSSWFSSPLSTICGPFDHSLTCCLNCPLLPSLTSNVCFIASMISRFFSRLSSYSSTSFYASFTSFTLCSLCHLLSYFRYSLLSEFVIAIVPLDLSKFPSSPFHSWLFFFLSFFLLYFLFSATYLPCSFLTSFSPPFSPSPFPPFTHPPSLAVSFLRLGVPFP